MSFSKMLISLSAAAMLLGASLAASAAPPPPPGGPGGGPGFHHPGGPGFWGPALTTGIVVGAMTYPREPRVVERIVEVPAGSGGTTSALPPASYPWYWCNSEQGYYPTVRSCPLGWETIMGSSPTTPPAPPQH